LTKVSELINPVTGEWDVQLIQDIFWPEDVAVIMQIPIDHDMDDLPAWHFDAKGLFSVKSAYMVAVSRRDVKAGRDASTSGSSRGDNGDFEWYRIWKLQIPNIVKMFMWRLAHNSLPVRKNVSRRGVELDTKCPVYQRLDEDCGHLFFKCKYVKRCWSGFGMDDIRTDLAGCQSGKETLAKIWKLEKAQQMKVIVFLWRWWSARNKASNGERMQSVSEILGPVAYFLMEFDQLQSTRKEVLGDVRHCWRPPPPEFYKINADGAFDPNTRTGGWGFVVQDTKGEVMMVGAGNIQHVASPLQAEMIAMLRGVQQAAWLGMQNIILETGASMLAYAFTSTGVDRSPMSCLVCQIRDFFF